MNLTGTAQHTNAAVVVSAQLVACCEYIGVYSTGCGKSAIGGSRLGKISIICAC